MSTPRKSGTGEGPSASTLISKRIAELGDWCGASLKDPAGLFNASLEGNTRRAIDIHEGEEVDERAFKALIGEANALNSSGKRRAS